MSERIIWHIMNSINRLPVKPILVLAGDPQQGLPLDTVHGQTSHVCSMFQSPMVLLQKLFPSNLVF